MSTFAQKMQTHNKGMFTTMSDFQYIQKLGTGSFGNVNLYIYKPNQNKYAIKIITGENITNQYESEGIEREIRVHSKCRNPNIIQFYDAFYENQAIYMVLEYVENGNLFSHIQKHPPMTEAEACKYFTQVCYAIQYMHQNNIFHRDIKPENLLLDEQYNLKICDFGWCAENINQKRKTFCGTYEYMAPEIVMDVMYDYRIDIWSLGILLYELIHKSAPFKGKDFKDISLQIKLCQPQIKAYVSKEASNLIYKILQVDPSLRPSFQQIFQSSFVKKYMPAPIEKRMTESQHQENLQPRSPSRQFKLGSPRRRVTEYTTQLTKNESKSRINSPKPGESHKIYSTTTKLYISPARRIPPKGRNALEQIKQYNGPIDLRGKDPTKIVYMNLCNNHV